MIKVLNQYFPGRLFVLLVTENILILLGIWAAVVYHLGGADAAFLDYPGVFGKAVLITAVCQMCLYYADIYDLRNLRSKAEVVMRVLQALGAASLILGLVFYLLPQMRFGPGVAETSIVGIVLVILVWRILIEWINRAYGAGERILLVGTGTSVNQLAEVLQGRRDLPLSILGAIAEDETEEPASPGVERLGTLEDLDRLIRTLRPDRVIIGLKERRLQLPINILLRHRMKGMLIEEASSLYQKITGKIPVESIHPSSLIFTDGFQQSQLRKVLSRALGFVAGVLGLIALGPFLLLVAVAIKLDSKGPVLYRQTRVGINGTRFEVLKFRSMRTDAESISGPVWAQEDDPRVTRVGRILRILRIDEFPQLLNVLYGEMSIVGPRPERPHFVEQLEQEIPFYELRHSVRPGITGWAQISHHYGATVEDSREKLEYDLFYIKNNSFSFDCLILFQTVKIMLFGRGSR